MASPLNASQLTYLAQEIAQLGEVLDIYANKCEGNPNISDAERAPLVEAETALLNESGKLATAAIGTIFDDSTSAFQSLQSVTTQANAKAHDLALDVANISRVAAIATAMIDVAVALNGGGAIAVAKAIAGAHSAIWS